MMNEEQRRKIYMEIKTIMTEKDNNNRYTNGNLTLFDITGMIKVIFYTPNTIPLTLDNIIENNWNHIIQEMKNEVMMSSLNHSFKQINVRDISLSNLLTNLNLNR
jgi:hypothetical protein